MDVLKTQYLGKVVLNAPYLGRFLSNFVRVKSNVPPRLSTLTYPRKIFDRTTPLSMHIFSNANTAVSFYYQPTYYTLKMLFSCLDPTFEIIPR